MKHFQAAAIAAGSVVVASSLIVGSLQSIAILLPLGAFALFRGLISGLVAPALLPDHPVRSTKLMNLEWIGWVGLGSLIGGLPLWLAARLPDDASVENEAGLTVVAVVIGLALIEILKKLAVDDDFIEKAIISRWKRTFTKTFVPLLENGTIPPDRELDGGKTTKSYAWQALYLDSVHGGYRPQGRILRARDIGSARSARIGRAGVPDNS